jgi:hypothetical protein
MLKKRGMVFINRVFKGGVDKKGEAGLIGRATDGIRRELIRERVRSERGKCIRPNATRAWRARACPRSGRE